MLHHNIDHQIAFINFTKVGSSIMCCKFLQVLVISTLCIAYPSRSATARKNWMCTCLCPELIKLQDKVKRLFLIESKTK